MKVFVVVLFLAGTLYADKDLKQLCLETVKKADSVKAVEGGSGWLFPFKEIQHLAKKEQFSEKSVEAIVEYKTALAKENVELLVVPVPPKSLIYKELLTGKKSDWNPYRSFHEKLEAKDVKSLDLVPLFYQNKEVQVFCKRDSHFSPRMSKLIAGVIFTKSDFQKADLKFSQEKIKVDIEGDLVRQSEKDFDKESFLIEFVTLKKKFVEAESKSPAVLLGDSNCLIYSSGGDMHTRGAGVFDYLSQSFGQSIDLLGVKGSGVDAARIDFFRRCMDINYLRNKKLVIWLFAAYELTESRGWKNIPVRR